jgi:hypothetical protein
MNLRPGQNQREFSISGNALLQKINGSQSNRYAAIETSPENMLIHESAALLVMVIAMILALLSTDPLLL